MKNLQYILSFVLFALLLSSGCVKDDWSKPEVRTIPTSDKFIASLNETFDDVAMVDGLNLLPPQGWYNTGRGLPRAFQAAVMSDTTVPSAQPQASKAVRCVAASAYLTLRDTTDAWLITPPMKVVEGAAFTYTASFAYNFASAPNPQPSRGTVEVWCYSASSTGAAAPSLSTLDGWTQIATLSSLPEFNVDSPRGSDNAVWFHFYPQSHILSSYKNAADDVMYVGFRYFNIVTKGGSGNTWYFDDVKYN